MRFRYKVAIFLMAVLIPTIGFNLIALPSLCLLEMGKNADYEMIGNRLVNPAESHPHVCHIDS